MQSWHRALSSLRAACSTSGRSGAARAFADAAGPAAEGARLAVRTPHWAARLHTLSLSRPALRCAGAAVPGEGAKTTLHRLLAGADRPLTSTEVWAAAAGQGLKSKRFVKQMLVQMKRVGHVKATPLGAAKKHQPFGYSLNRQQLQQRAPRPEEPALQ
jgi:hypothetical protein